MDIRCKIKDLQFSINGNQVLSLELQGDFRKSFNELDGKELIANIKPYKEKRSKDANAYMWVLCEKLAQNQGISKDDVYRNAIREVGIFKDFPNMSKDEASTLQIAWGMIGTGWLSEQVDYMPDGEHVLIRCYYGSSTYNSKQMSRLIDYIVTDCKAVGIETMTPAELERLYASM